MKENNVEDEELNIAVKKANGSDVDVEVSNANAQNVDEINIKSNIPVKGKIVDDSVHDSVEQNVKE